MKHFPVSYVLWIGLACTAAAPLVQADGWDKRTVVTFNQPVEIPRVVLGAGTYVVKVVDNLADRDIVQFLNQRETHVFATVLAIPDFEPNGAKDHTTFTFEERASNAPQALKTWFYPGDDYGEEFVYPKAEAPAPAPAPATLSPRPAAPEPTRSAVQPAPASAPVIAQNIAPAEPAPQQPVEVAQAQPTPTPAPAPENSQPPTELPHTASALPLIALFGALSAGSGALLRTARRS